MAADLDFKRLVDGLAARWRGAWEAEPADRRGVETAASLAAFLAAEVVEGFSDDDLAALRATVGYPPQWSRPHAIASLTGIVLGVGAQAAVVSP